MTKQETGGSEIAYLYGGEVFDRTVEISCKKNNYRISYYKETLFGKESKPFKTLPAAKKCAEKWFNNQIDLMMKALKKLKMDGVAK